jgi:hypothetical protein
MRFGSPPALALLAAAVLGCSGAPVREPRGPASDDAPLTAPAASQPLIEASPQVGTSQNFEPAPLAVA